MRMKMKQIFGLITVLTVLISIIVPTHSIYAASYESLIKGHNRDYIWLGSDLSCAVDKKGSAYFLHYKKRIKK